MSVSNESRDHVKKVKEVSGYARVTEGLRENLEATWTSHLSNNIKPNSVVSVSHGEKMNTWGGASGTSEERLRIAEPSQAIHEGTRGRAAL